MKHFAELFKYQRGLQLLSLVELSKESGVPIEIIEDIENGNVLPSKIQMEKLAACPKLGISYEELVQWKEAELKHHWQELGFEPGQREKWVCPYRRWDCPCCNWPFSLKCELTDRMSQTMDTVSVEKQ